MANKIVAGATAVQYTAGRLCVKVQEEGPPKAPRVSSKMLLTYMQLSGWQFNGDLANYGGETVELAVESLAYSADRLVSLFVKNPEHSAADESGFLKVAEGTRVGDGSITLAEKNSSGISGSVTLAYTSNIQRTDGEVIHLYPQSAGKSWLTANHWRCEEVVRGLGTTPSKAIIVIPNNAWDETAGTVSFNPDGPITRFQIGRRVMVERYEPDTDAVTTVFVGSVVQVRQGRDENSPNSLTVIAYDDRWLLQELRIIGRWVADKEAAAAREYNYQAGWPAHFNPGGRPNCIFFGSNWMPSFTPCPDYGLEDGEEPPEAKDRHMGKACYWTLGNIMLYLWKHYGPQAPVTAQSGGSTYSLANRFPFVSKCPDCIIWPDTIAADIDKWSKSNFDSGMGQGTENLGLARKGRDLNLEGVNLLDAFDMIMQSAGPYALCMEPQKCKTDEGSDDYKSVLSIKSTRFKDVSSGALSIPYGAGGQAADSLKTAVVTGGTLVEDGENYLSSVGAQGSLVLIEQRAATAVTTVDAGEIETAWSSARYELFRKLAAGQNITIPAVGSQPAMSITGLGGGATKANFEQACAVFPDVLTTYRWRRAADYQSGAGSDAAWPRAPIARPMWPQILSTLSEAGVYDYAGRQCPFYVESLLDGTWNLSIEQNGLEFWDNGVIYIPMLRDWSVTQGLRNWRWVGAMSASALTEGNTKIDISQCDIRMCLTVPADHRSSVFVRGQGDVGAGNPDTEDRDSNPDADRILKNFTRRGYVDLDGLYQLWLRTANAYPMPQSAGYTTRSAKATRQTKSVSSSALRDDYPMLLRHAQRMFYDRHRLQKGGNLRFDGRLVTAYLPGLQVGWLKPITAAGRGSTPLRAVVYSVRWYCSDKEIFTELTLG